MSYVETSGYSYKEWKGSFYPEKIPAKDMLASRFGAVRSVFRLRLESRYHKRKNDYRLVKR